MNMEQEKWAIDKSLSRIPLSFSPSQRIYNTYNKVGIKRSNTHSRGSPERGWVSGQGRGRYMCSYVIDFIHYSNYTHISYLLDSLYTA